ncbi:hypothetical protein DSO57_1036412 [Entomophthora muscae]|uniref:Uncharacterized protein n=1 Tax=Entomophthora muscae TaxID=34485 RepID=A0ACC2SBZ0_9FUNG|nr:hypothetical protein DSO57_1036412 [Entomophthora muscae]
MFLLDSGILNTRTASSLSAKPPKAPKKLPPPPSVPRSLERQSLQPHLLPLLPPLPSSSTSPSPSPQKSRPIKSDGDLTNHSFYHSEADSEPTKECRAKKAKAAKEPTSSSGKKKEASKQASKNPSPPPPNGSSPPSSSDPQDEPEDYSKKFKASGHVAWDPLAIHNICNVDGEFKVPKCFPRYFLIMSVKGSPGYVADNYIFNCNNQKWQTKSKHFVCKDKTCGARLNTEGWAQVMLEKGEHTCEPPII